MRNKILYVLFFVFCGIVLFQSCVNEETINYQRYYVNGKGLYDKYCQNCHGANGQGLGTLYPPLTDSTYLIENKAKLACIIRNGQNKSITVNKVTYRGQMPANASLPDIDIAQLIVYISNSFGNDLGYYDVTAVNTDLKNCN